MLASYINRLLDWIAQFSSFSLAVAPMIFGAVLLVIFYLYDGFGITSDLAMTFLVCGFALVFSALPFHFYVGGSFDSWRTYRKARGEKKDGA